MAVAVIMPKQGQSVESCILTRWNVKVGDAVKTGDILFEYETDKSSFEEECAVEGIVLAIFAEEGDDIPCMENVCVIGQEGEDISAFVKQGAEAAPAPAAAAPTEAPEAPKAEAPVAAPAATVNTGDRVKISPRARAAAATRGIDGTLATPTGPNGRIIERDIFALAKAGVPAAAAAEEAAAPVAAPVAAAPAAAYEDIKHSGVRKAIARSMHASLSEMAQLTNSTSFDATDILAYRQRIKESKDALGLENITLNDIVMFAVAKVLMDHKGLNAHYNDEYLRVFSNVNLGMAVDTQRGLLVPTIFGAESMTLNQIARESKAVAAEAQTGKISPDKLSGGTFTISNLGAFGIESFTPVINPPQVAILGVCGIQYKMKKDGSVYPAMGLSLTYDHRAVDGAPASRFLKDLCTALENFSVLLAK